MLDISLRARGAAEQALSMFKDAPQWEVLDADRNKFQAIYPLASHAMEQTDAALSLIDRGLPYAAEANARTAFQHAMTAQWVLLTHEGEEQALAEMRRNHSATVKDFSLSVDLPDELLEDAGRPTESQGPARDFWRLCSRFSSDKALYVLFRRLSDSVHPSLRTLTYHLEADDERGVFGVVRTSPIEPEPDLLIALALSSMLSLSAVETLRKDQVRMAVVRDIAARWEVPMDLRADDASPHLGHPSETPESHPSETP